MSTITTTAAPRRPSTTPAPGYKRLTLDLPQPLHTALKLRAITSGVTIVALARQVFAEALGDPALANDPPGEDQAA